MPYKEPAEGTPLVSSETHDQALLMAESLAQFWITGAPAASHPTPSSQNN